MKNIKIQVLTLNDKLKITEEEKNLVNRIQRREVDTNLFRNLKWLISAIVMTNQIEYIDVRIEDVVHVTKGEHGDRYDDLIRGFLNAYHFVADTLIQR